MTRRNRLQNAVDAVREIFHDAIECRIKYSGKSYAEIARLTGCSEQLVFQVAKLRGLGRNSQLSDNQHDLTGGDGLNASEGGSDE